ncbi:MAG: YifB family Mg chelatase-like AAA ATPase [Acidothermales bacterium]|nr:YifB family Mg chelatase-like AAA ATPase [Acidothermales bacterium]
MTLARAHAAALVGVQGHAVEVEADLAQGLPTFVLVGLPDTALSEARDRVRAAVVNSGESWPARRITVSLSPAALPKRGSGFDLPIAVAVLAAAGGLPMAQLEGMALMGELGLDGQVRPVRGVLPSVLALAEAGVDRVVVPAANAAEAQLVPDVRVLPVRSLRQLVAVLRGEEKLDSAESSTPDAGAALSAAGEGCAGGDGLDLADVLGQSAARTALEVSAAGGHHLFLYGPPGTGKTMLAERLPGLLPALDRPAALEVTTIHSVAGTLPPDRPLMTRPPFHGPHHTATLPAIVGGGSGIVRPGAVSLAHRGVLFLDEAPEFASGVLDALRQPLECGEVVIARAHTTARFPARFTLVLAANPCPCGRADDTAGGAGDACNCTPHARIRYLGRLSGPLLDRVDLRMAMRQVSRADMISDRLHVEPTHVVAARVAAARERAVGRLAGTPWRTNAEVASRELRRGWAPRSGALRSVERLLEVGALTARGVDRVVRVAWTLADLAGRDRPGIDEVDTAVALRQGRAA